VEECPKCGAAFLKTRASHTYCSAYCRIATNTIRDHERLRLKFEKDATCANRFCARPFKKLRRDHRFCQASCYQAPPNATCANSFCARPFTRNRRRHRFCKPSCAKQPPADSRTRNATSTGNGYDVGDAVLAHADQRQNLVLLKLSETGPKRLQYRMLEMAIIDVRHASGAIRADAAEYLRGERDDRLPASIRAQDCFDTFGLDAQAVRQSLGI